MVQLHKIMSDTQEETYFEVFDKENCNPADIIDELMEYSRSQLPIYCTESQDEVYAFFSNIPITDERVQQWYIDLDSQEL